MATSSLFRTGSHEEHLRPVPESCAIRMLDNSHAVSKSRSCPLNAYNGEPGVNLRGLSRGEYP